MNTYTVGALASMAGVSVRTLHHYDDIGLLNASDRTNAGYRVYTDADVDRLQAILAYRELGLGLEEIQSVIEADQPSVVLEAALDRTHRQIRRLRAIASNIEATLATSQKGTTMTPEEKLAVFGDFDPDEYTEEARARWGDSEAFAESTQRTSAYGADEWRSINDEAAAIYSGFHELAAVHAAPSSPEALGLVEEHRAHISRWFYECTPEIHAGLGAMYTADQRFADTIDKAGAGTAAFMSEAIAAAYSS